MLRPGKKVNPNDPYKDAFEYGIWSDTERAKERGNQHTNVGNSKKDQEANNQNDLLNLDVKMRGHSAGINFITFLRMLGDEQRASSLNADFLQLCDVILLMDKSDPKILMPLFAIGESTYRLTQAIIGKIHDEHEFNRGDQTLSLWILHNVIQKKVSDHYQRIKSIYGGYKQKVFVQDGMQREKPRKYVLFMSNHKNYSNVFQTDPWHDSYHVKARRSPTGLGDVPCFKSMHATMEELNAQGAFHFETLKKYYLQEEALATWAENLSEQPSVSSTTPETPGAAENPVDGGKPPTSENTPNE